MNVYNKTFFLELYDIINSLIMSMPLHVLRKIWMRFMLSKMGHCCVFHRHLRNHTPWRIKIGEDVVINRNVMLDGRKGIEIGDSVDIGEYTLIWSLQHNTYNHGLIGDKVVIGDHVWIAPHCIILPGVSIGRGSVIATGSVVTKSVPEHCLYGGIPAKKIKDIASSIRYRNNHKAFF